MKAMANAVSPCLDMMPSEIPTPAICNMPRANRHFDARASPTDAIRTSASYVPNVNGV
jgi:hypothetical protein